ncbi:Hypothetical predicted protein [Lecanosticta acicola]|uniref:Uncharacterized protein n=1 Tax=Lecanosticta acicola TaxID=111012 RepID=A0AAI9EBX4_9PEZI|nr:Hypothetical predicted protein [Lecanosticta acicola]
MADNEYEERRHPLLKPRRRLPSAKECFGLARSDKWVQRNKLHKKLGELKREPSGDKELRSPNSWFTRSRQPRAVHWLDEEDVIPSLKSPVVQQDIEDEDDDDSFEEPFTTRPRDCKPTYGTDSLTSPVKGLWSRHSRSKGSDSAHLLGSSKSSTRGRWEPDRPLLPEALLEKVSAKRSKMAPTPLTNRLHISWSTFLRIAVLFSVFVYGILSINQWLSRNVWNVQTEIEGETLGIPVDPLGLKMYNDYVKDAIEGFTSNPASVGKYDGEIIIKVNAEIEYLVDNLDSFNENWVVSGDEPELRGLEFTDLVEQGRQLKQLSREIEQKSTAYMNTLILQKHISDFRLVRQVSEETVQAWKQIDKSPNWQKKMAVFLPFYNLDTANRWFPKWQSYLIRQKNDARETQEAADEIANLVHRLTRDFSVFSLRLDNVYDECEHACQNEKPPLFQTKEGAFAECNFKNEKLLRSSMVVDRGAMPALINDGLMAFAHMKEVYENFADHFDTLSEQAELVQESLKNMGSRGSTARFKTFLEAFTGSSGITLPSEYDAASIVTHPIGASHYGPVLHAMNNHLRVGNPQLPSTVYTNLVSESFNNLVESAFTEWTGRLHDSGIPALRYFDFKDALEHAHNIREISLRNLIEASIRLDNELITWLNTTQQSAETLLSGLRTPSDGEISTRYLARSKNSLSNFLKSITTPLQKIHMQDETLLLAMNEVLYLNDKLLFESARLYWRLQAVTKHATAVCGVRMDKLKRIGYRNRAVEECLAQYVYFRDYPGRSMIEKHTDVKNIVEEFKSAWLPLTRHNARAIEALEDWKDINGRVEGHVPMTVESLPKLVDTLRREASWIVQELNKVRQKT